jgi:hypothetical protein
MLENTSTLNYLHYWSHYSCTPSEEEQVLVLSLLLGLI